MPTNHVLPESAELLQEIADSLWKAKKVLVVTGAGISTNSGIPDFRSKNGLYSLIQAQFDAVANGKDDEPEDVKYEDCKKEDKGGSDEPATKRQKLDENDSAVRRDTDSTIPERVPTRRGSRRQGGNLADSQSSEMSQTSQYNTKHCTSSKPIDEDFIIARLPALNPKRVMESLRTPRRRTRTSILSSSDSTECQQPHPQSSSPLSSPPSILFDPAEEFRNSSTASARSTSSNSSLAASNHSSDTESDSEETTPSSSQPTLSSQSSFSSNRGTLPAMKGRDLFDASIWADPVKTSVFYTFATTLRQKVREVVPTRSHEFISHLRDSNKLVRCYTQNIDEIEEKVGLTTSLVLGPGKKGRFSARSQSRASTGSTLTKDDASQDTQAQQDGKYEPQELPSSQESQSAQSAEDANLPPDAKKPAKRDPCFRGVECVFLHGSLRLLRCFRCGQTTPWDEAGREHETMSGRQPSCPRCAGATAAREGRGKRALAVGKLRPDIVLYGEEHPNAHLISPIVQHDISIAPDMLLILGTSLKVHGLKVLIREFSKAVHSRGGKVVFVNFTKPPESVWSDVIDYWVQWDCDTWVQDLKERKPVMWMSPGSVIEESKKKRKSIVTAAKGGKRKSEGTISETGDTTIGGAMEECNERPPEGEAGEVVKKARKKRQPKEAKEPKEPKKKRTKKGQGEMKATDDGKTVDTGEKRLAAVPDDNANGAFMVWKIMQELSQATGRTDDMALAQPSPAAAARRIKSKPRHSAPAGMQTAPPGPAQESPVPLPNLHLSEAVVSRTDNLALPAAPFAEISANSVMPGGYEKYSILSAVKANPRQRRTKKIFEAGGDTETVSTQAQAIEPKPKRKQAKPRKRPKSMGSPALPTVAPSKDNAQQEMDWSGTDRVAEQLMRELATFQPWPSEQPAKTDTEMVPAVTYNSSPPGTGSPRTSWVHAQQIASSPSSQALKAFTPQFMSSPPLLRPHSNNTVLPPIRHLFPELGPRTATDDIFFYQDPLSGRYEYPSEWPSEWPSESSCATQLEREAEEQFKAAVNMPRIGP